jgi:hypothetical protein
VQLALAESALRRSRWREARQRIDELAELYPGDLAVQRALRDLAAYNSWELRTEFRASCYFRDSTLAMHFRVLILALIGLFAASPKML